jgi:rSAM/selenodomain-associated transferase 2
MSLISIIIPVFNEAAVIEVQLQRLQAMINDSCEVIVVDGGSQDDSVARATPLATKVIVSPEKGRAQQMNAGAAIATGRLLLFLHCDTCLADGALQELLAMPRPTWGFFTVTLSGLSWQFRVIEWCINRRSTLTQVATGDQCLFIEYQLFKRLTGFAAIALMEDVDMSKRLRRVAKPVVIERPVVTSSRRWEKKGIWQTVILMWRLRLAYFLGASPEKLAAIYYSS